MDIVTQADWSGGSYQNPVQDRIPENGSAEIVNGLLEEDGAVFKRGGSAYKSNTAFGTGLRLIWDGYLGGGQRTVFADGSQFGTLAADDATPVNLSGGGAGALRPTAGNYMLVVPTPTPGQLALYGGSRKTAAYGTGTITATAGSKTVTGSGTAWLANVDPGMILGTPTVLGVVESVQSDTALTLKAGAFGNAAAVTYSATPVFLYTAPYSPISAVASISNPARLVVANNTDLTFSTAGSPFTFAATDYHRMPQGAAILGMEPLRNVLFVFTTKGVFTISGMDYQLTDASGNVQQSLQQISQDLILWDQRGMAAYAGSLIVPCTDDVWLLSSAAAPQPLSVPIRTRYRQYVRLGYQCGHATVSRNHYFLPIVNGTTWIDTLICRLDGGGWVFWNGHGGTATGFAQRASSGSTRSPLLLSSAGNRINDLTGTFTPTVTNSTDADTSQHQFSLTTRDYSAEGTGRSLFKKIRLRYELAGVTAAAPGIGAGYGIGTSTMGPAVWDSTSKWADGSLWDGATAGVYASLPGQALVNDTTSTLQYPWPVVPSGETGVRDRYVRFKFTSSGPSAKLVIRSLDLFQRSGGRQ